MEFSNIPGKIRYAKDRATVTAGDITIHIDISEKELRRMYLWGKDGRLKLSGSIPDKPSQGAR